VLGLADPAWVSALSRLNLESTTGRFLQEPWFGFPGRLAAQERENGAIRGLLALWVSEHVAGTKSAL
jgi:hypothetical protein